MVSAGFLLSAEERNDEGVGAASLSKALRRQGFTPNNEMYQAWKEAIGKESASSR
jgi:hypothetical protein